MSDTQATTDQQRAREIAEQVFRGCVPTDTANALSGVLADRLAREFAAVRADAAAQPEHWAVRMAACVDLNAKQHARIETLEQVLRDARRYVHASIPALATPENGVRMCERIDAVLGASHVP